MKSFFNQKEVFWFFAGLVIVNSLLIVWAYYDHGLPVYDTACHILSGFSVYDLIRHAHFRNLNWWQSLMTVNSLYPPFVYLVYGILKLALGPQHWVDILVHLIFASILFSSMYGLGKLIFEDYVIALLSGLIIFIYPNVFALSHYDLLDLPGLAMVALALVSLIYWQNNPSLFKSILLGTTFALAALTKNNCVGFLIPSFIFLFGSYLYTRNWSKFRSLIVAGFISLIIVLPWLILACPIMIKRVCEYQNAVYTEPFIDRLFYYLNNLSDIHSLLFCIIFVFAVFICPKTFRRRLLLLWCSTIGGVLITSLFRWPPLVRYVLPVTILTSLYCSLAFKICWLNPITRPLSILSVAVIFFAFFESNFTPYPFPRLTLSNPLEVFLGISPLRNTRAIAPGGISICPAPPNDLGTKWVLNTIKMSQENTKQKLTILPDTEEVSLSTYLYLIKQSGLNIDAISPRYYMLMGDKISFNPDIALKTDWCLLCTNGIFSSLSHFSDKENEDSYNLWCNFVRHSKNFKLAGNHILPSGTRLELYKRVFR